MDSPRRRTPCHQPVSVRQLRVDHIVTVKLDCKAFWHLTYYARWYLELDTRFEDNDTNWNELDKAKSKFD